MATKPTAPRTQSDARVRHASVARSSRAAEDEQRTNDAGTALTVEEQRRLIRSEFQQEALPTVPTLPGWHFCWLSTTNSYDPINKRMRLGYVPVRYSEVPGFESMKMKSGEFEGCVSCNEMLLFKIPEARYQAIMQEFHHHLPLEEEEALRSQVMNESATDSKGKKLAHITEDSDGYEELMGRKVPRQGVFASS